MWDRWVFSVLPYLEGPRVLEVGHGPGHLQLAIHAKGLQAYGLDESRQMGRLAVKRIKGSCFLSGLVNGYAQSMPFSDASFHQVVATFPSEFISEPASLDEIYRVLVPGGLFLVLPSAWITGNRWYHRLAAWLFRFTGQAPDKSEALHPERLAAPFQHPGFEVYIEHLQLPDSSLLLIKAYKPA
jgi:ubiquinone/menaquinone biosynthesis C-methylase UbiE